VHQLESVLDANPWVADAQVYVDAQQKLHVWITQRVPVARLFEQNGNSYYLDQTLKAMPLSSKYSHYTTVVTNVPVLKDDSLSNVLKAQLVSLVKFIDKDSFWNAQVSQVIMTDDKKFELVPVLGNHRILFGDTTLMDDKFSNLFSFYKKVLNRIGWDKYETLDVRYAGQVVASPALEWKKPADKMMSNMDWVKSIIGNEEKPAESDTTDIVITNTIVNVAANTAIPAKAAAVATIAPVVQQAKIVTAAPAKPVVQPAKAVPVMQQAKAVVAKAPVKPVAAPPVKAQPVVKTIPVAQTAKTVAKIPAKPAAQPAKTLVAAKATPAKQQVETVAKVPVKPAAQSTKLPPVAKATPAKKDTKTAIKATDHKVASKNTDLKKPDTKPTPQATVKPVAKAAETPKPDKREKEKNKEKQTNEKSPKYIYQGN
jgi:cell division protein FtsQ